ncbi:MAG: hypothetical protein M3Q10_10970, partial [Chloroflexota bacterium]|nr:hypothetical protein [Chloroflexota bacterium]
MAPRRSSVASCRRCGTFGPRRTDEHYPSDSPVAAAIRRSGPLGEIGTLAYHCGCAIVDAFTDRVRAVPLIGQRLAAAGPVVCPLLE